MQQLGAALFGILGFMILYYVYKHRTAPIVLMLQEVTVALLLVYLYHANTSGDNSRMLRESGRYFPTFSVLTILQKLDLGFSSTWYCLSLELRYAGIAFLVFTLFLFIAACKQKTSVFTRIFAFVPVAFVLLSAGGRLLFGDTLLFQALLDGQTHYRLQHAVYQFHAVWDCLYLLLLASILHSLFQLIRNPANRFLAVFCLAIGLGSRVMMGFSPTVWASGYRTFFLFWIACIVVTVLVADRLPRNRPDSQTPSSA